MWQDMRVYLSEDTKKPVFWSLIAGLGGQRHAGSWSLEMACQMEASFLASLTERINLAVETRGVIRASWFR